MVARFEDEQLQPTVRHRENIICVISTVRGPLLEAIVIMLLQTLKMSSFLYIAQNYPHYPFSTT